MFAMHTERCTDSTVVMQCSTTNIVLTDHMIKSMRFCNGIAQSVQAVK